MFYCPHCHRLREQDRCRTCGRRPLMAPRQDDQCFLEQTSALWAGMLEDVLRQAGIPYLTETEKGAALTAYVGVGHEKISFYVPYGRLAEARDLTDGLFHLPESEEKV